MTSPPIRGGREGSRETDHSGVVDEGVLVGERLFRQGQEMLRRREERAEASKERDIVQPKEGPKLPPGRAEQFYTLQKEWLRKKDGNLHKKRDEAEREEREQFSVPLASARSVKLLEGKEYKGPIDDWKRREQQHRMSHAEKIPVGGFTPTISPAAQQLRREGAPGERLFKRAAEIQKSKKEREAAQRAGKVKDEQTGQILFTPVTRRNAVGQHSPTRRTRDEIDMQVKGMAARTAEATRKKEKKIKQEIKDHDKESTFAPKLNERSEAILMRTHRTPVHLRAASKEPSPSPERGDGVKRGVKRTKEEVESALKEFLGRMDTNRTKVEKRIRQLKEEKRKKNESECCFRPSISSHSSVLARQRAVQGYVSATPPVERDSPDAENIFYAADVSAHSTPAPPPASSRRSPQTAPLPSGSDRRGSSDRPPSVASGSAPRTRFSTRGASAPRSSAAPTHSDPTDPAMHAGSRVSPQRHHVVGGLEVVPRHGVEDSFAQWEAEWERQQREIDEALRGYEDAAA
eukprot:Hpha_TRINITY_DN15422_c1_g1::TRINITY_DN15422_c1_g1_i1::g.176812::m.176812